MLVAYALFSLTAYSDLCETDNGISKRLYAVDLLISVDSAAIIAFDKFLNYALSQEGSRSNYR